MSSGRTVLGFILPCGCFQILKYMELFVATIDDARESPKWDSTKLSNASNISWGDVISLGYSNEKIVTPISSFSLYQKEQRLPRQ